MHRECGDHVNADGKHTYCKIKGVLMRLMVVSGVTVCAVSLAVSGLADEVGQEISSWVPGTLEIHQISSGRGNAGLFIFPDGTTMLVDAGEIAKKPNGIRRTGRTVRVLRENGS